MRNTKKFKQFLSCFLASAMLLGNVSVPVYAAEQKVEMEESETESRTEAVTDDIAEGTSANDSTEDITDETEKITGTEDGEQTDVPVYTVDDVKNDSETVSFPEEDPELLEGQKDVAAVNNAAVMTFAEEPTMEIPERCFGNEFTEYDTYYYTDGITYTYKGEIVNFVSGSEITAGTETYSLKNKKTNVTVTPDPEAESVTVNLSGIDVPVLKVDSKWNRSISQLVYRTDIPGMEEVRSAGNNHINSKGIVLSNLKPGTYHLTEGQVYESANQWSPGLDFGDGKGTVKERFFGVLPDIEITVTSSDTENNIGKEYWGVQTEAKVYKDFENDIWLQYQQKDMNVGEAVDLYPWRVHQIVTDTIHNDVVRPDFHFEIISGDSVELSTNVSNDKARVTAKKPGTSVVKVTYDAMDYKGKHWDAISDVNTAYAVYTVGEDGTATINTNDEFQNWRHYDTIYYKDGETTPYTFTVDAKDAESVKVILNGLEIQGQGNTYTADLENRSNIIGIETKDADGKVKSMYRVIDARFIEVNVENTSFPDQELRAGDKAKISFRGITMPVYKLATIYNPCFGGGTWVNYRNAALGDFTGKCSQWDLATRNSFDVTFPEKGEYLFQSKNGIYCSWWGDNLGSDMRKQGQGTPNTNANTLKDYFSFLPDFTVSVAGENYTETVDSRKVVQMIENLPSADAMTLRDKQAVDEARKLYDKLEKKEQSAVTNYDVLEAAEKKIQELLKTPFIVSLNKEILTVENTEEENGHGGYYYKVSVPEGVDTVQLERYKELAVLDQTEKELYKAGTATVDLKNIAVGKENYLVLKEQNTDVSNYIYFENAGVGFEVSPKVIYPGTEVTVTLKNLPAVDNAKAVSLYTKYKTNIPGLGEVKSSDAKDDITKLSVLTFTVPQETESGTYHMTDGFVEKEVKDPIIQGMPRPNSFIKLLEGELPEINITVADENRVAADAVIDKIDALGEITSLEQEKDVVSAREAYDALTDEQKKLVTNLDKLKEAEAKIKELKIPTESGYVTVDIERFTIGQGFYREPVKVAFEAGQTVKDILKMLESDNLLFNTAETYLSGIKGADAGTGIKVPEYISEKLGGPTTEEAEEYGNSDDVLGEFDYYPGSGWYYFVNNEAPDVGVAEYYAKPGDVIRLQFTLCWGKDLAGTSVGDDAEPLITVYNKDEALGLLAEVNSATNKNELLADKTIRAAYDAVAEIVQNALAKQEKVDAAAAALKEALEKGPEKPEEEPTPTPTPTPEPGDPTPTPEPEDPKPEQKPVTLTNKKYGICLTGKGLMEEMELIVTPLAADSSEVSLMRKAIPSTKGVTKLYDVKLMQDGNVIDVPEGCELSLNVNEKYNGKELSMLFCVDGKVKEVKGTVKEGVLTVPFEKNGAMALVLDLEKDTDDKDTNAGSNGTGTGGSGSGKGTSSGSSKVKTGDEMPLVQMLWMLAVSGCVIVLALKKRRSADCK